MQLALSLASRVQMTWRLYRSTSPEHPTTIPDATWHGKPKQNVTPRGSLMATPQMPP